MIPSENKLLNMLSNNDVTFFIPPYQRNYEWTDEQCSVFFEDIKKTKDQNVQGEIAEHFFGTITFFQDETPFGQPNILILIDGQQRITTTMLFLVALRDIIKDQKLKDFIDSKYLKNNNVSGDSEYKIKLKQVETDWAAYRDIILHKELSPTEKNSAVYRNYMFFTNKLMAYRAEGNDIGSLIDKGLDKFSVITIELQPHKNKWENPQEIFESMNSLGKPLSLADLVRNYLLLGQGAKAQEELYHSYWMPIEKSVPGNVSDFLRDFMQLKSRASYKKATDTNTKELYSVFKEKFPIEEATQLLKELSEYAPIYAYLLPGGECGETKIDYQLADFQRLRVTTAYSFMMSLLMAWRKGRFSTEDASEIMDAFRIYCLRRRLIGLTTAENKVFPTLTRFLGELEEAGDKRQKMFEILANQENNLRLPNDVEIERYLETANFYNFQYARFYLALIEEKITKCRPDMTDKHLQIEHIMPQTLNDIWMDELGEDYERIHQEYLNTIGNLTLIRHNQELGNKSFTYKKEIYNNKAGMQLARTKITDQNHWTEKSIQRRAKWIISYLTQDVLPIPEGMRKTNNFSMKNARGLSFVSLQLIGLDIDFIADPSIVAHVVSDKEVEFEGKKWRLSPLTKELQTRRGKLSPSGSYQGAQYWEYDGIKLADII